MDSSWVYFAIWTIVFIIIQGFFSMMEMACVSFNKVRLQYFASQGNKKAIWLMKLLNHPTRLFGTTLIGVNAALQFGSECSRRVYSALGVSPDWAPLTQILLVCIFAELSPMFAARRYPEHVVMLGIRWVYMTSIIMRPIIWFFDILNKIVAKLFKSSSQLTSYISRDELQRAIEDREDRLGHIESDEFDNLVTSIFSLKNKTPRELMYPIRDIQMLEAKSTVGNVKMLIQKRQKHFYPIYQQDRHNVIGIVYPRDLLRLSENLSIREYSRSPWFITESNSLYQIIKQFRWNNQNLAVVLNDNGQAIGILTLDAIIDELLSERSRETKESHKVSVNRSFPSDTLINHIQQNLGIVLEVEDGITTLEELMTTILGHHPSRGESIRIGSYELSVVDAPLIGEKVIRIRSLSHIQ